MTENKSETIIDLLRHGRCEGGEMVRGSTNVALSSAGWIEMRTAATTAYYGATENTQAPWSAIVSSPMLRCSAFAAELSEEHDLPLHIAEGFREIDFGEWEGRQWADIAREEKQRLSDFWNQEKNLAPPGGESLQVFSERVTGALGSLLSNHHGKHILLVCHGGTIRMLLGAALKNKSAAFSWEVPYANTSRLRFLRHGQDHHAQLVFHNRLGSL